MKKNKKKKLSRKDRFKEMKKEAIPMCSTPLFLKNAYEISIMTDSGLFQIEDGVFSKLYKLEFGDRSVKADDVFKILRGYDCKFRIYYIKKDIYLNILLKADKADVWVTCGELYKNMSMQLSELAITVRDINTDERMKFVHGLILDNENLPFDKSYMDNEFVLNWKDDFELINLKEEIGYFYKQNDQYKVFYVREFSDKISEFISDISEIEDVKEIISQFDPVSDKAVQAFFKKNYMGTDNLLENIQKNNADLYNVFTQEIKDDSKHFTMCGVMFLVKVDNPEVEEKINFSASRYDIEIAYFHIKMLDMYKEFLPIGKWHLSESRNVPSDFAGKIFLPGILAQEEPAESIDDFLLDSEFIFDQEEPAAQDDDSFDIDAYDDDDEDDDDYK